MANNIKLMGDKLDNLQNRLRRSNLRLDGLPESVLQKDLQHLCEVDLLQKLGINCECRIERGHRLGPDAFLQESPGGSNKRSQRHPQQVIMRFLDYNDKLDVITFFRKRGSPLELCRVKILLFSADVAKCRHAFSSICSRFYAQKIRF